MKPGDWVRYFCTRRCEVVIDVVLYVRRQRDYPWKDEVVTAHNIVAVANILETRVAPNDDRLNNNYR